MTTAIERFHAFGGSSGGGGALTFDAQTLGADVPIVNAWQTILTTSNLDKGTWLVSWHAQCAPAAVGAPTIQVALGTAVGNISGPRVSQDSPNTTTNNIPVNVSVLCIVTITAAGTLLMQARDPGAGATTVKFQTTDGGFVNCTGYTAVKIA